MESAAIKSGYNRIGQVYDRERAKLKSNKYIDKLLRVIPPKSLVLDLGCGNGVPVDRQLVKKGHLVIGIDIAASMIKQARINCPQGEFKIGDMLDVAPGGYSVEAVVSMYAMFHLPRGKQGEMLRKMNSFLKPDGWLLITMGDREFEGWHDCYGVRMWASQYGPAKNREMIVAAGFKVVIDELDTSGGERHQVILARKK